MKELFFGDTRNAAIAVSAVAFALGFGLSALLGALFRGGCKCSGAKASGGAAGTAAKTGRQDRQAMRPPRPHQPPADGSIEIYVGNLNYEMTDEMLRKEFEPYGTVNSARIIVNRFNGKSKGFGFVHMPNRAEVEAAIAGLSDREVLGRRLKCNVAHGA